MNDFSLKTRREFLKTTVVGGAMSWTVPSFIQATIQTLFAQHVDAATAQVSGKDGPILVVLQLAGGNDGLNTIVPFQDDDYYRARPTIGIRANRVLKINDDLGFHPGLSALSQLYNDGMLALVQGVGYPNPNRSHFRSTEIWHTASDADRTETRGWLGRYFDNQCQGEDASCGIAIGAETPQAFFSESSKGITFADAQNLRFMAGGAGRGEIELFQQLNNMEDVGSGASISSLSSGAAKRARPGETAVDFLERTALDAQVNTDRIRAIVSGPSSAGAYPGSRIGRDLHTISRLIAGGMPTRVYYASQGGYDTHTNQAGNHERLLGEFSDAMRAFIMDLKSQGNLDRVLVMTFSEFGRRVSENQSGGTDHGAAAPLFIAGGKIRRGVIGEMPSLRPSDLDDGDIRHAIDFRSVYATLLSRHMHVPVAPILGRTFPELDLI